MIDHLSLPVSDFARSRAFYDACLAPLGHKVALEMADHPGYVACGYGPGKEPTFWIGAGIPAGPSPQPIDGQHIAFAAADRKAVDAFHAAALAAGGACNGPPGLRPDYHADYYAAFVIDPDGYHLEAVCHSPPG